MSTAYRTWTTVKNKKRYDSKKIQ